MYGFSFCSNGKEMLRPMFSPRASDAPRFAASMIPGPPPSTRRSGRSVPERPFDHCVRRRASSRASS
jgi:hypothetical protein